MRRIATLLGLLFLLAAVPAWAQTGKIAGTVIDAVTGEPLIGVNVVIEGTMQGTVTNIDGEYVIIGVRPGTYTVIASFIGFQRQRKEGVGVNVDLTTTVDFRMSEEVFEGEEIVVTAEAEAVRKDVTSSEARVTAETLDRLPVTELGQVLDVQAGITSRNGLHIRGGRSSEVVYMVDGVPVTDAFDGSPAIQIENDGIQELQVISGTFNAEYGNAMSGVINVVTKEGSSKFAGSVKLFSGSYLTNFGGTDDGAEAYLRGVDADQFVKAGIQYRDVDPYGYLPFDPLHFSNINLSLEGPIWGDRVTFFVLGRYFENDGWLYGVDRYNIDGSFGSDELVPMNSFEKYSAQANLKVRLNNTMIVNLIGLGSFSESQPYDFSRRWTPDGRGTNFDTGYNAKLRFTHLVSATTFYTIDVANFYREAEFYLFEDVNDPRYNDFNINPPDSVQVAADSVQQLVLGGNRFLRGGTNLGRFNRSTRTFLAKADLSSQLGKHHLVKMGVQVQIDNQEFTSFGLIQNADTTAGAAAFVLPQETSASFNSFDGVSPLTISAYIQDKIEYENFIVNAGLRLDYFDSRNQIPADPSDPNIFSPFKKINRFRDTNGDGVITEDEERADNELTIAEREEYWWEDATPKVQISPRLGVAYPITEQGVIHFSFGLFFQMPTISNAFANFGYKIPSQTGNYGPYGNPNIDAQKTTMYEIGFKQGFGDFVLDLTGYYRDVRAWVSTSTTIETELPGVNYVIFTNKDYANTRGLTATFSRKFADHYGFDVSYTFQVVEGSNSNPADEFFASLGNNQPTLALLPLDWDQRHKLAGAYYMGWDSFGGSVRFRYESGFPYTPAFSEAALVGNEVPPEFATNARRLPPAFEIDLNLYKEFDFGRLRPRIFLEVFNLFDARNVAAVYGDTGEPDVTLNVFNTADFDPGFFVRPEFYREPRRVQLGIDFKF